MEIPTLQYVLETCVGDKFDVIHFQAAEIRIFEKLQKKFSTTKIAYGTNCSWNYN